MTELLNTLFSPENFKVLSFISVFVGVYLLARELIPDEQEVEARRRLGVADLTARPNKVALLRWFRPIYTPLAANIASKTRFDAERSELHRKLISANVREEITPDEFIAFKFVMMVFIPLLTAFLAAGLEQDISWGVWPLIFVAGYFYPVLWLHQRAAQRRKAIVRAMPYVIDLLTLSVEAGLDFIMAIQRLIQRSKENALTVELNYMLKEIRLGTSRSDALRSLSDRLQIEEIASFTSLLIQADQLGVPIGEVLRAQADQLRTNRFQSAEAAGARASQLVLLPLVICIFPVIILLVLGPVMISLLSRGLF